MMKLKDDETIHQNSKTQKNQGKSQSNSRTTYYDVKSATKKLAKLMKYKEEKLKREQERLEIEK